MVENPTIRFPVTCPQCGKETLGVYPIATVAIALLTWFEPLTLTVPCHPELSWIATRDELDQIREYLRAGVVESAGLPMRT
jgi:hypothetical protein